MKSSNILHSEKDSAFEGEHNEFVNKDNEMSGKIMYMPTLPSTFNSLVEKTVKIEMEKPCYIIELLGDLLDVNDYKTNKAAFWFLDIIALQVLRYKNCLDDYYRSVLISWLVGEMKLIRDKKLLREDFFKEMRILFLYVAEKLSNNERLLHWELLMNVYSEIISQNYTTNASANSEYLITNKLSQKELITEDAKDMSLENKFSFIERDVINHNNKNSVTNDLQKKLAENFTTSSTTENLQKDIFTDVTVGPSSLTNPSDVLDIIVEATYDMYANELRYTLIYAVFVKPIQIQICHMPHSIREPRQIKLADPKGQFDVQLREQLEKIAKEETDIRKEKIIKDTEIPASPPPSLTEEEILANNRRFILPLIEANEAAQIFEMHAGNI